MDACVRRTTFNPEGQSILCILGYQSISLVWEGSSCLGYALSGKTVQRAVPNIVGVAQNCTSVQIEFVSYYNELTSENWSLCGNERG